MRNDRCLGEPAPLLILAYGRGSELARDLPGNGSKTGTYGTPGATEVPGFGAALLSIAPVTPTGIFIHIATAAEATIWAFRDFVAPLAAKNSPLP
ncbi:hypothetical protein EGV01_00570 [Pseudomonas syringae pv. theae]|nr:hypothetical protein [Pseudomonas syringae pv. theae]